MPGACESGYARAGTVLGTVQALAVPGARPPRVGATGDGHGRREGNAAVAERDTHAGSTVAVLIMAQDVRDAPRPRAPPPRCGCGMAAVSFASRSALGPTTAAALAELHARTGTRVRVRYDARRPSPSIQIPSEALLAYFINLFSRT